MDVFNVIVGISSILSLFVSIFTASKAISIQRQLKQTVRGNNNILGGRDVIQH